MSDTPTSFSGSWVDLTTDLNSRSGSGTVSPIMALGSDSQFMRMLREAQGETSNRTSCRVSPHISSLHSPKSPPPSPNTGLTDGHDPDTDLGEIYINTLKEGDVALSDFIWDWSSRPNITPPKRWKFASTSSKSSTDSFTLFRKKGQGREKFFYTVVFTNILSLIIGAGIGIWFFRRSSSEPDKILSA